MTFTSRNVGRLRPRLEDTLAADTIAALEERARLEGIPRAALHDRLLRVALGLAPLPQARPGRIRREPRM